MVGHWFHAINDFATTWLPLALFLLLGLMAWLLWKTVGMMPRVKPAKFRPSLAPYVFGHSPDTGLATSNSS